LIDRRAFHGMFFLILFPFLGLGLLKAEESKGGGEAVK
jgi:hypothetical protein